MASPPHTLPVEDVAALRAFVVASEWIFAKTMPEIPHWYTYAAVRRTSRDSSGS